MSRHTIYLGSNERMSILEDTSVHLVVTSPPYVTTEFKRGQEFDYEGFLEGFARVCGDLFRVLVPGGRFALNIADIITKYRYDDDKTISRVPLGSDAFQVAQTAGFRLLERFIWDKGYTRNFGGPLLGSYPYPLSVFNNCYFEHIFVLQKPGKRRVKQHLRDESRLTLAEWREWSQQWWRVESISEKFGHHGAVFPLEIPSRLIRMYSYAGDVVLDPYMGTGATMLAAERCGRKALGFEIDPACKDLVERRIEFEFLPLVDKMPEYDLVSLEPIKHPASMLRDQTTQVAGEVPGIGGDVRVLKDWQALGWQHQVWDLVRYYRSLRGTARAAWLEELGRRGCISVGNEGEVELPVPKEIVETLLRYLDQAESDHGKALDSLRTEKEALDFCKSLGVTVGKTTTKNTDHHQSSKALVGAVTAIAAEVCKARGLPLVPNPQRRNIWCTEAGLHVTARNLDGSVSSLLNANIIWEIKEYWGKTSGGSKMSDAVYECNLVGRELRGYEDQGGGRVHHLVFVDGRDQWMSRKSDLMRFIDLEHQGVIDRLFVGSEVESEWENHLTSLLDDLAGT